MAWLRIISGVGTKGPACFLVEANGRRLLLDLGEGPPPGLLPDLGMLGPIDAVVLTHGHRDHVGGLSLLPTLGNPPVYATAVVARGLPRGITTRSLPVRGKAEILGIAVETGRDGHAPGGVWLHFDIGRGLLYTGDICAESVLYAYDPPAAPAATAVIDCSYADDESTLDQCWTKLAAFVERSPLFLPVPANGRGPEIALQLMRHGITDICIDDATRGALGDLAADASASLRPGLAGEIARLAALAKPIAEPRGVMLAAAADGASGAAARLLPQFARSTDITILFTGYINPGTPAQHLTNVGRALTMRWNVHPRLSDATDLIRAIHAETVVPAFCDRAKLDRLGKAFLPAHVTMDGPIEI